MLRLGAWLLIRAGLVYSFRNNPGVSLEWHLGCNIAPLVDLSSYFLFRPTRVSSRGGSMSYLALLGWIAVRFCRLPGFVQTGLLPLVPLVAAAFCFGHIDELRDCYEVYPAIMLALTTTMAGSRQRAIGV